MLLSMLREHEGLSLTAYRCTAGRLTIGYGHTGPDVSEGMTITKEEAERLLRLDCDSAVSQCRMAFDWFTRLCDLRQAAIADLVFNMGLGRLKGFVKMITAIEYGDFETAANELLMSKYASQLKRRAVEIALLLREGSTVH